VFIICSTIVCGEIKTITLSAQNYVDVMFNHILQDPDPEWSLYMKSDYGQVRLCIHICDQNNCYYDNTVDNIDKKIKLSLTSGYKYCLYMKNTNLLYSTNIEYSFSYTDKGQSEDIDPDKIVEGMSNVLKLCLYIGVPIAFVALSVVLGIFIYKKWCKKNVVNYESTNIEEGPNNIQLTNTNQNNPPHIQLTEMNPPQNNQLTSPPMYITQV
jgi:hypothetical protein